MTTPMETIYEKTSVLEVVRLSIELVAVQMACIVIDNYHRRLFKPCAKDIEGVYTEKTKSSIYTKGTSYTNCKKKGKEEPEEKGDILSLHVELI